jgi:hypothetical protein
VNLVGGENTFSQPTTRSSNPVCDFGLRFSLLRFLPDDDDALAVGLSRQTAAAYWETVRKFSPFAVISLLFELFVRLFPGNVINKRGRLYEEELSVRESQSRLI